MDTFESVVSIQYPAWNKTDDGFTIECRVHGIVFDKIETELDAWQYAQQHNESHVLKPGCYVDGGHMNVESGTEQVIEICKDRGFVIPSELQTDYDNITWTDGAILIPGDYELQREIMELAINYLNENWIQDGYWAGWHDGDFGVWPNDVDECPQHD